MANIFGRKHDIDNQARPSETTRVHTPSRNFVNYGPQRALNWTVTLPTLRKFWILLHCHASHTEVSKQNSTKLCDMLGSKPDLHMHVKNLRFTQKLGSENCLFCDGSHLDKSMPDDG